MSEGQRTWNTHETELLGLVRMVENHGSYITTATARFPTDGPNFKAKIGFLSDSTTAIGRWKKLTIPIGDIAHLSAKSRRFFSWADICAGTEHWSFCISHLSGDNISLPHMLSHLGNLAKTKQKQLSALGVKRTMCPVFIHSSHNGHKREAGGMDALGYSFNALAMSPTDLQEMQHAYLGGESPYLAVPMKTIYRIIAMDDNTDINAEVIKKVTA